MARAWIAAGAVAALLGGVVAGESARGGEYTDYVQEPKIGTVLQRDIDPREPRQMDAAGIDSVRFWVRWNEVAHGPDKYVWWPVDETIRKIASAGLTPMPFIFGSPAWAARQDGFDCGGPDCTPFAPSSFATRSAFASFTAEAVRRYGREGSFWQDNPELPYRPVREWQIWNEPNLQAFWRPWVDAIGYAELVKLTAERIRAEDPEAEVVLAGVSGGRTTSTRWSPQTFMERFYDVPRIWESFEGVAVHPYAARMRGVRQRIAAVRAVIEARDPGADLWITEIGWASAGSRESTLVKTLRRQAKMLHRAFTRLLRHTDDWNLRGIYWYAWRDTDRGQAVCAWCGKAGLRDRDGKAKPAYHALRRVTG